jgi:hypothetical protein
MKFKMKKNNQLLLFILFASLFFPGHRPLMLKGWGFQREAKC